MFNESVLLYSVGSLGSLTALFWLLSSAKAGTARVHGLLGL